MKRYGALAVIALIATGCAANDTKAATATQTASYAATPSEVAAAETSEQPSPTAAASKSPRGYVVKKIGEQGSLFDTTNNNKPVFTFSVDEIVPGYQCQGDYPPENKNGQFIAVKTTFTTGPDLTKLTTPPTLHLSEQDWKIIGADGVQEQGISDAFGCAPSTEQWPQDVGTNVTVKATFVLDTRNASGIIAFTPWFANGSGWEWQF